MTRRTPLIIAPALPAFVIGLAALTLGSAAASYRLGHDAGRIAGQAEAHRETDRVLGEMRAAFDLGPDASRGTPAPESRHTATTGDAP